MARPEICEKYVLPAHSMPPYRVLTMSAYMIVSYVKIKQVNWVLAVAVYKQKNAHKKLPRVLPSRRGPVPAKAVLSMSIRQPVLDNHES